MIKIKTSKTFVVKPAEKTPPGRSIPLTVLDKLFVFPHYTPTAHIYRPTGSDSGLDSESLRESLSKVLVHFYPIAGRFVRPESSDKEEDITEIICNDQGVTFVVVETDSVVDDLGHLSPSSDFSSLIPPFHNTGPHISSYPLMLVQVTYFRCGGVSLCIAMEHQAVDGSSAFHLIKSWSEIFRGLDISVPPFLDRKLHLSPRDPPQPKSDHQEYTGNSQTSGRSIDLKISTFRLNKDQLNQMKTIANQNQETTNFTAFEVLAGHTWKCVCRARELAGDQDTRLLFTTNARSNKRVGPLVPPGFFGNAIFRAAPKARAGDLQSKPFWYAATIIHEAVARIDNDYAKSVLDFLAVQPDLSAAIFGPHILESPNFNITSWVRVGLNDADFGWGPPVYSEPAGGFRVEKAFILSRDDNSGELSLAIALEAPHMEVFGKLFYEFA